MMRRRGILGNSLVLAAGNCGCNLLGLIFIASFARLRGAADLGMFQYAASIASLASLVVSLGLDVLVVREVARDRERSGGLATASLAAKAALSIPALACVLILAAGRYGGAQGQLLMVVTGAALLDAMTGTLTSVFRGFERMEYEALAMIAGSAAAAGAGTLALAAGWSLVAAVSCWTLGSAVRALVAVWFARGRFFARGLESPRGLLRALAGPGAACGSMAILGAIYSNADIVMLRELASPREVGWYTAATRLIGVVLYVPSLVTASLFPVLSRQAADPVRRSEAASAYDRAFYAMLLMGLPAGAGACLTARPVVRLVYGEGFEASATALALLSPYLGWFFVNLVNGTAMVALGRQNFLAAGTAIATAFNVAANAWAIPRYGVAGACVATLIASGAGAVLYTIVCHRELSLHFRWDVAVRAAVCTAAMSAAVAWLLSAGAHVLLVIPAGALAYGAGLAAAGAVPLLWVRDTRARLAAFMERA